VLWVEFNRPEKRNAFNPEVIAELKRVFTLDPGGDMPRVVVLAGRGDFFCAGAGIDWMQETASYSQNQADADALAEMLGIVDSCPVPVIARVQGGAFGGGLGLLACCDSVVAEQGAKFAFSEVRLGLSPATIAPYVLPKIGAGTARDLFLSGAVFDTDRAFEHGLVHTIVPPAELDAAVEQKISDMLRGGPMAMAATKRLIKILSGAIAPEILQVTAKLIAELRASPEGQEGLAAFLEKRDPSWVAQPSAETKTP
jgi:methylglutaconyl-CoA hydratase